MALRSSLCGRPRIYLLAGLSLLFFFLFKIIPFEESADKGDMLKASMMMAAAEKELWACREEKGAAADESVDINRTGLIGVEMSMLTTTLGSLEAKRTATNPNFAGLLVRLLKKAGVKRGEVVAVGASCSFPGLIAAVLAAAKTMDLEALFIYSLGASQWGANEPAFEGLDVHSCLVSKGYGKGKILALTIGGEGDIGQEMNEDGRRFLLGKIRLSGMEFFEEPDLERNVAKRIKLYKGASGGRQIKAFINIGGSWANLGEDASVLRLKPGLARSLDVPSSSRKGIIQEMAGRGIPVIHLLNIKGLAERYGLPWDPSPLPRPGQGEIYRSERSARLWIMLGTGAYILLTAAILIFFRKDPSPSR